MLHQSSPCGPTLRPSSVRFLCIVLSIAFLLVAHAAPAAAAPEVTAVVPSSGSATGGETVRIRGSGFAHVVQPVCWFGDTLASAQYVSAVGGVATTPAHAKGSVDVTCNFEYDAALACLDWNYGVAHVAGEVSALDITADLTVELWFSMTSEDNDALLVGFADFCEGSCSSTGWPYELYLSEDINTPGAAQLWIKHMAADGQSTEVSCGSIRASPHDWHHIAWVRHASAKTYDCVLNGKLESTTPYTHPVGTCEAGCLQFGYDGVSNAHDGRMDEIRVWNEARSVEQIVANMDKRLSGDDIPVTLMAYYPMDTGSGMVMHDASGNGFDATLGDNVGNNPTWMRPGALTVAMNTTATFEFTLQCPNDCSRHGTCDTNTGHCDCTPPFTTADCSVATCPDNCTSPLHGTCDTSTGVCDCVGVFHGDNCAKQVVLHDIVPNVGGDQGGLLVTVRGDGFVDRASLQVRFGSGEEAVVVNATWASSRDILAITPAMDIDDHNEVTLPVTVRAVAEGACLSFVGDGDHTNVGAITTTGSAQLMMSDDASLEVWMRLDGSPALNTVIYSFATDLCPYATTPCNTWTVGITDTAHLWGGHGATSVNLGLFPSDGLWHFLVVVRDNRQREYRAYLDGALFGWGTYEENPEICGEACAMVGFNVGSGTSFPGSLDNMRIWSRVLTAQEARDSMFAPIDDNFSVVASWSFDEGHGTTYHDSTTNAHDLKAGSVVLHDDSGAPVWEAPGATTTWVDDSDLVFTVKACSGHGHLDITHQCICDDGWTGPHCDEHACKNGCSDHGTCNNGVCTCHAGWLTEDCSHCNSTFFCRDRGTCSDTRDGLCTCDKGWDGVGCGVCLSSVLCHDHGTCSSADNGACTCDVGWDIAPDCTACSARVFCSGHGTCSNADGSCKCAHSFHGANCSDCDATTLCHGHGACPPPGETDCQCDVGWGGADCAQCSSAIFCSSHGTCTTSSAHESKCTCEAGWSGGDCSECDASWCHGHGTCTVTAGQERICACDHGFSGPHCAVCDARVLCSGNGVCNATTAECTCSAGWTGPSCSECDDSWCNGHGQCTAENGHERTCVCSDGYSGPRCTTCDDSVFCDGHGHCISMPDKSPSCACGAGWKQPNCRECDAAVMCHGHGTCDSSTGTCTCTGGRVGPHCDQLPCGDVTCVFGNCSTAVGRCVCEPGFLLPDCASMPTDPHECAIELPAGEMRDGVWFVNKDGHSKDFHVQFRDRDGHPRSQGGEAHRLRATAHAVPPYFPTATGSHPPVEFAVEDLHTGAYALSFAPLYPGNFTVHVRVDKEDVEASPFGMMVGSGLFTPGCSYHGSRNSDGFCVCEHGWGADDCSHECPDNAGGLMAAYVLGLFIVMLVLLRTYRTLWTSSEVSVDFLQILSLFHKVNVGWPRTNAHTFKTATPFSLNLEVVPLECVQPGMTLYAKYALKMAFPLIAIALIWAAFALFLTVYRRVRSNAPRQVQAGTLAGGGLMSKSPRSLLNITVGGTITFVILAQLYMTTLVFDGLGGCNSSTQMLFAFPSIQCESEAWKKLFAWCMFGMVVYVVGIPVLIGVLLYRARRTIDDPDTVERYGRLYEPYRPGCHLWEVINSLRKVFVAVSLSLVSNGVTQIVLMLLVYFLSFLAHYAKPYRRTSNNHLEFALLTVACLLLFCGLALDTEEPTGTEEHVLTAITMVVTLLGILISLFATFAYERFTKHRAKQTGTVIALGSPLLESPQPQQPQQQE